LMILIILGETRKTIILLTYHRHELLDLVYLDDGALYLWPVLLSFYGNSVISNFIAICSKCIEVVILIYWVAFILIIFFFLSGAYIYYDIMFCYKVFINEIIGQFD
jgi:hypothetical protein